MAAKTKFKEEAITVLKNSFENSDLEAINLLLEGRTKCNSVKKSHLEAFRKIIEFIKGYIRIKKIK